LGQKAGKCTLLWMPMCCASPRLTVAVTLLVVWWQQVKMGMAYWKP
jgi:hypothetical protein